MTGDGVATWVEFADTFGAPYLQTFELSLRTYLRQAGNSGLAGYPDPLRAAQSLADVRAARQVLDERADDVRPSRPILASGSDIPATSGCESDEVDSDEAARLLGLVHARSFRRIANGADPPVEPCFRQSGKSTRWRRVDIDRLIESRCA